MARRKPRLVTITTCAMCGSLDVYRDVLVHCNNPDIERDDGDHWCESCDDSTDVVLMDITREEYEGLTGDE